MGPLTRGIRRLDLGSRTVFPVEMSVSFEISAGVGVGYWCTVAPFNGQEALGVTDVDFVL